MTGDDEEWDGPWYSGVVYCPECGVQHIGVWPECCDETTLQCSYCGAMRSVVVSLTLTEEAQKALDQGGGVG